eukprot:2347827-Pyramimonas_sp.AAC.1
MPTQRRPRLIVTYFSSRWMLFDKYESDSRTWEAVQRRATGRREDWSWIQGNAGPMVPNDKYQLSRLYTTLYPFEGPLSVEDHDEVEGLLPPPTPSDQTVASERDLVHFLGDEEEEQALKESSLV